MARFFLQGLRLCLAAALAATLFVVPIGVGYAVARPNHSRVVWVFSHTHGLHESDLLVVGSALVVWSVLLLAFIAVIRWRS